MEGDGRSICVNERGKEGNPAQRRYGLRRRILTYTDVETGRCVRRSAQLGVVDDEDEVVLVEKPLHRKGIEV